MRLLQLSFLCLAIAGCTQTITQQQLTAMKMRTQQVEASGTAQRPGNDLWYMGTEDGYDYYHYYDRTGSFDKENTYRTPAAVPAGERFAYTSNHNQWRKMYYESGSNLQYTVPTTSPTKFDAGNFHL